MADEDADVLERLTGADVHAFAKVVGQPTTDERRRLVEFLGEDRYARLRDLALRRGGRGRSDAARGNVVVIPGMLGTQLAVATGSGGRETIWPRASALAAGGLMRLGLGRDGRSGVAGSKAVQDRGILTRHYGELLLTLAAEWEVRAFWYDWRKDLGIAASELETQLREWFPDNAPVHLIGHGIGGLVARRFAMDYSKHWSAMAGAGLLNGGRLIMLGTPNRGAPAAAQVLAGLDPIVRKLSALDVAHSDDDVRQVLASFPSLYQLLPPHAGLYRATTWGELNVGQSALDLARKHHELLAGDGDERTITIAGVGRPTVTRMTDGNPRAAATYEVTTDGDGHVPRESANLDGAASNYFLTAGHAELLLDREVLRALPELLESGGTTRLASEPPACASIDSAAERYREAGNRGVAAVKELASRQARAGEWRGSRHLGAAQEREVEDLLMAGIVAAEHAGEPAGAAPAVQPSEPQEGSIAVSVMHAMIQDAHEHAAGVDAVAVGHYVDVAPQAAEAAIDATISNVGRSAPVPESERLINGFTNRGVLAGRLGEVFLIPDPRDTDRIIALAGMGEPGRFGVPELTVLARELCWSLGRLSKSHLATVLIGSGNGNLRIEEAVEGWMRGLHAAIAGSPEDKREQLAEITFAEEDPRKIARIHRALKQWCAEGEAPVRYRSLSPESERDIREKAYDRDRQELDALWQAAERGPETDGVPQEDDEDPVPTRISLSLVGNTYSYGAITADASVPEREIPLDPELVGDANDEIAAERRLTRQMQRGEFLGRLLLPRDLTAHLTGNAPIVMMLDDATARINWEMVATEPLGTPDAHAPFAGQEQGALDRFLGTSRGFTRQLRTRLAPPPDPPPPPRRTLKVLVIADPAEDLPLLGAQEEGQAVADLFASFNHVWQDTPHRVEVTPLFGHEATRTNVLRHLISERYDVLHYAGHCAYDPVNPARSGWIFTGDKRLTVNELSRVDRIPKFVFSNACESGVTADDAATASSDLAPGFAQAFFARGVSNFVCTAWPVNDRAALAFAKLLYGQLLALPADSEERPARAAAMYKAMRLARCAIATTSAGRLTWGAYQHYGNPYFRLFDWLKPGEHPVDDETAASVGGEVGSG